MKMWYDYLEIEVEYDDDSIEKTIVKGYKTKYRKAIYKLQHFFSYWLSCKRKKNWFLMRYYDPPYVRGIWIYFMLKILLLDGMFRYKRDVFEWPIGSGDYYFG